MKWLAALLVLVVGGYAAFKVNFPTYTYRYRLQLSLAIEDKIYTGSSVIEVIWGCGPQIPGLGRCAPHLKGQAAVIDIGSRGVVIAALYSGEHNSAVPDKTVDAIWLCANAFGSDTRNEQLPELERLTGRRNLSPDNFPRLVWFPDPADMKTARKMTFQSIATALEPTAHFTEAFVEITRDPVVIDIAKTLPWYPDLERAQRGKGITSYPGRFQLVYNMFVGESS